MKYFDQIAWIDLDITDEFRQYHLLGQTLSAISHLSMDKHIEATDPSNDIIVGIDLMKVEFFFSQNIGDLSYVVTFCPIFCFNYSGTITKDDDFSQIVSTLRRESQIIPVVQGPFIYDRNEHYGNGKISTILEGAAPDITLEDNAVFEKIIATIPFSKNVLEKRGITVFDKTMVTWLGVGNREVRSILDDLFSAKIEKICLSDFIKRKALDPQNEKLFRDYVKKSNLFCYDESSDDFIFKFNRSLMLPKIRNRIVKEFEEKIARADLTDVRRDEDDQRRYYWYYNFEKLFSESSRRYMNKLGKIVSEIAKDFEYDKISVEFKYTSNYFGEFMESCFEPGEVIRFICSPTTRLFPYDRINKGDRVVLMADIINTGNTINSAIDVIERFGGTISGIFCMVINSALLGEELVYKYNNKEYELFFLLRRKLKKNSGTTERSVSTVNFDEGVKRSSLDFLFFWELVQEEGNIEKRHYCTRSSRDPYQHGTHWDMMLNLNRLSETFQDSLNVRDFLNRFHSKFYDRKFELIISNTSRHAPVVAKIIAKFLGNNPKIVREDFNTIPLSFRINCKGHILLVDDGINSYGSLVGVAKWLVSQGYKNRISACAIISRKCIGNDTLVKSNRQDVLENCDLYVYYKSNIPFYMVSDRDEHTVCPTCYLREYYRQMKADVFGYEKLEAVLTAFVDDLPNDSHAPEKVPKEEISE